MKHGKKYVDSLKAFDRNVNYDGKEALELVAKNAKAKFDETIEAHFRLGVDSRHADQQVRGAVVLPHGTGKKVRVLVIAKGDKATEAEAAGADYVVMAGYMRKVTPVMLDAFPDRVLNLHPALLPSFKGAHAIQEAFDAGVKVTGITVHFANEDYDKGPIVAQRAVEVREDDTLDTLEERIHEAEHALYPEVLRLLAEGRVSVGEDRKVHLS